MPTENEIRVLKVLSAIEVSANAAEAIQALGNEAVTVLCEAALGTYPGLRPKVRYNAVALLGQLNHPQAMETVPLLISDSNSDVSIRAMRAAGRQKNNNGIEKLGQILRKKESPPLIAAEAVSALLQMDSEKASASVAEYVAATSAELPHRGSRVVRSVLDSGRKP